MNNETSYFYSRLSVSKSIFMFPQVIFFYCFCGNSPSCGGPGQLRSLPFLKSGPGYGFTKEIFDIRTIIDSTTYDLFNNVKASNHCITYLLPPHRPLHDALRIKGHQFQLPNCIYKFHEQSFIISYVFRFLKYFLDWFYLLCITINFLILYCVLLQSLQCFDAVGWATGRATGL